MNKMRSPAVIAGGLFIGLLLHGCGGGGDSGSTPTLAAPAPVISTLNGSGGDMTKYANSRWVGGCGILISGFYGAGPNDTKSVINTFEFGSVTDSSVSGTLSSARFVQPFCSGQSTAAYPKPLFQLTYVSQVAVTTGNPPSAQGTADVMLFKELSSGATQTLTFAFLPGLSELQTSSANAYFSAGTVTYTKR